jgi:hypothetical protein
MRPEPATDIIAELGSVTFFLCWKERIAETTYLFGGDS